MTRIVLLLFVALTTRPLSAQETAAARGTVVDARTGRPIEHAIVVTRDARTITGGTGDFRLQLVGDTAEARITAFGFVTRPITLRSGARSVIALEPQPLALSPVSITGERAWTASSSRTVRALDLELRPHTSSQQLLMVVPGLVVAQHAGGGKAEQIFLRGFDADHGTDVAVSVDGTPVNLVSHAHGQGYADLHFLIPELVERIDVRKGPYDPRDGDFATAGSVALRTRDRLDAGFLAVGAARFGERNVRAALPFGADERATGGYLAVSALRADGPFDLPQDHERWNLFARMTAPLGASRLRATVSSFGARWNASGQVPERAVRAGLISRFGAIDPTEGGSTGRHEASLELSADDPSGWRARAWLVRYDLDLFSNFTFFRDDPVRGDGIVQRDRRTAAGIDATLTRPFRIAGASARHAAGFGARTDIATVELGRQHRRAPIGEPVAADVRPLHAWVWLSQEIDVTRRLRIAAGLRADAFRFAVTSQGDHVTEASALLSPKLSLAFDGGAGLQLFGSAGAGFHSNDTRALLAGDGNAPPLVPRAIAAEIGARHTSGRGSVAATVWALDLESELVFVGDEGTTEAGGRSRRIGVDLEARARVLGPLWADADLNLARGRLRDAPTGADRIPLAPTRTASAGLVLRDGGPFEASARVRHVAVRPADEEATVTARAFTIADLFVRADMGPLRLRAGVENLLDAAWNEAQFATTSQLRSELAPVTDLHFTPGAPRTLRAEAAWRF